MRKISVRSFGPIREGEIEFGDLTVLVGPQASGKSLLAQLVKAIDDAGAIRKSLRQHGFDWLHGADRLKDYLSIYFGAGMESIWHDDTEVAIDGRQVDFVGRVVTPPPRISSTETVFLVPAQRVMVLQDGWPRPFMSYAVGDPYCLRSFSDALRRLMEQGLGSGNALFPQPRRLKAELRRLLDDGIYVGGKVKLDTQGLRKRVVLEPHDGGPSLPYSAWSAGQREFTPLLLGLYWLLPSAKITKKQQIQSVVIEEPEMGLHPQAILSFCLVTLELLHRGYRVIVSTHSPIVLDVVWALRELMLIEEATALAALKSIFGIRRLDAPMQDLLSSALQRTCRTYYFNRTGDGVTIRDISSLDPGSDDEAVSGWGGLSGFSGDIADRVGEALAAGGVS